MSSKKTKSLSNWSFEEDRQLLRCVKKHGTGRWNLVARWVGTRSVKQCQNRWSHILTFVGPQVLNYVHVIESDDEGTGASSATSHLASAAAAEPPPPQPPQPSPAPSRDHSKVPVHSPAVRSQRKGKRKLEGTDGPATPTTDSMDATSAKRLRVDSTLSRPNGAAHTASAATKVTTSAEPTILDSTPATQPTLPPEPTYLYQSAWQHPHFDQVLQNLLGAFSDTHSSVHHLINCVVHHTLHLPTRWPADDILTARLDRLRHVDDPLFEQIRHQVAPAPPRPPGDSDQFTERPFMDNAIDLARYTLAHPDHLIQNAPVASPFTPMARLASTLDGTPSSFSANVLGTPAISFDGSELPTFEADVGGNGSLVEPSFDGLPTFWGTDGTNMDTLLPAELTKLLDATDFDALTWDSAIMGNVTVDGALQNLPLVSVDSAVELPNLGTTAATVDVDDGDDEEDDASYSDHGDTDELDERDGDDATDSPGTAESSGSDQGEEEEEEEEEEDDDDDTNVEEAEVEPGDLVVAPATFKVSAPPTARISPEPPLVTTATPTPTLTTSPTTASVVVPQNHEATPQWQARTEDSEADDIERQMYYQFLHSLHAGTDAINSAPISTSSSFRSMTTNASGNRSQRIAMIVAGGYDPTDDGEYLEADWTTQAEGSEEFRQDFGTHISKDEFESLYQDCLDDTSGSAIPPSLRRSSTAQAATVIFSSGQMDTLRQQMRANLQIVSQALVLEVATRGTVTPTAQHWQKQLSTLVELDSYGQSQDDLSHPSFFCVPGTETIATVAGKLIKTLEDPAAARGQRPARDPELEDFQKKFTRPCFRKAKIKEPTDIATPASSSSSSVMTTAAGNQWEICQHEPLALPVAVAEFLIACRPVFDRAQEPRIVTMRYCSRVKFFDAEDILLWLGLRYFGADNSSTIRSHLLPTKTNRQIENRVSNLRARRQPTNAVKSFMLLQIKPLTLEEEETLQWAVRVYGRRFRTVSREVIRHRPSFALRRAWAKLLTESRGGVSRKYPRKDGTVAAGKGALDLGDRRSTESPARRKSSQAATNGKTPPVTPAKGQPSGSASLFSVTSATSPIDPPAAADPLHTPTKALRMRNTVSQVKTHPTKSPTNLRVLKSK
ncbi:hypothetical protein IWQ60_005662 [Tieghemiomyces parasiticus]|uniref:Uncharacterized protein n=1 Tax=Tieghemiomyces parasiticus TaxID=78921 RepID=A0A9W8A9D3_9FUNG|nr:hypothetical protein IWQ60_005662 [Tieghemiomyces parasiticus]